MISAIIINHTSDVQQTIEQYLACYCPYIYLEGVVPYNSTIRDFLGQFHPELVFLNHMVEEEKLANIFQFHSNHVFETILIGNQEPSDYRAINRSITGCLKTPIKSVDFILAINKALYRILERRQNTQKVDSGLFKKMYKVHCNNEIVGIPTIEGYEFIEVNAIVRCEGLQKCTRVVTIERKDIISSYNLGEFARLLGPFGFFSPHKSHLININMVRKYHREGTIYMQDGSHLPVARRRKEDFLLAINHL